MMKWRAYVQTLNTAGFMKQQTVQHIESKGEPQDCFGAPEEAEPSGKKSGPAQIMELT